MLAVPQDGERIQPQMRYALLRPLAVLRRPAAPQLLLAILTGALLLAGCAGAGTKPPSTGTPAPTWTPTTAPPTVAPTATTPPAAVPTVTVPPTVAPPTATPPPAAATLRVAFIKGDNVWLWEEGQKEPLPLTRAGEVTRLRISDDGALIAYQRGEELRVVRSDGGGERALVTTANLAAMEPRQPGVLLYRFEWVPGTHLVAFNTKLRAEMGLILANDLNQVDADTLVLTRLLPPGQGGEFYYAAGGRQIAIVDPESISLVDADGGSRRQVLAYEPVMTYSEYRYYVQPAWSPDGAFLRVAIPPADPFAQPLQPTGIWHVPADGSAARLLQTITTHRDAWAFSPDLHDVAYLDHEGAAAPPPESAPLAIVDLDSGKTSIYEAPAFQVAGWSPDGRHIAFAVSPGDARTQILDASSRTVFTYGGEGLRVEELRWVDATRHLFVLASPQGLGLYLAELGTPGALIAPLNEFPLGYDFTWVQAGSANPWASLLGPSSAPPGWEAQPCEGDAPMLCVSAGGQFAGSVELLSLPLESMPDLRKMLVDAGVAAGPLDLSNAAQVAAALSALRDLRADSMATFEADRRATYPDGVTFTPLPAEEVQIGLLPGLAYGFAGLYADGRACERWLTYAAFDGNTLELFSVFYAPGDAPGSFPSDEMLLQFEPYLREILAGLQLPVEP
jgi:hypothetical protein